MCAATAGQRGQRVLLLDHATKIGEKIRISGGGHCNFTNLQCEPENFLSRNPQFCRSALARYTPADFIALVRRHRIAFHEKTLGPLFCAVDAVVSADGPRFRENLLFTHRGLSGPAILQASSYWQPGQPLHVNLLPDHDAHALLAAARQSRVTPASVLSEVLPKRFAQQWTEAMGATRFLAELPEKTVRALAEGLHDWQVKPSGTTGYQKAEVTVGGVDTRGLSSKTMEATAVPGLYFIGEVVDVTGWLGGFNFQWAWSSGVAAGRVV